MHRVNCGLQDYTLAHEIGHNYGMHHDADVTPDPSPLYANSLGHLPIINGMQRATVMGCTCGPAELGKTPCSNTTGSVCNRIQYFSGPDVFYLGTGPATGTTQRNNVNVARQQVATYASFRGPSSNTPPVANFTVSCSGGKCTFTSTSTDNGTIDPNKHFWNFGDSTAELSNAGGTVSHTYTKAGNYTVHLVVQDTQGQTGAVSKTASPNPLYEGKLETVNCRSFSGWAWDKGNPNQPINVDLYRGGTYYGSALANLFRQDLLNAGKGNGYHAFTYTPSSFWKTGQEVSVYARYGENTLQLTDSPKKLICKVGIFSSQTPASFIDTAGKSWSVGNVFSSSTDGYVTHLRYYKAAEETGLHRLKLWTETGQELAYVDVSFGTTARWVTGTLPNGGVPITAGTRYVVTVTTTTKQSKTDCGFSTAIVNGPITGHGGRWEEGDGTFPDTNSCSNFWTDVYFDQ